jgi:hypothetical protein
MKRTSVISAKNEDLEFEIVVKVKMKNIDAYDKRLAASRIIGDIEDKIVNSALLTRFNFRDIKVRQ